MSRVSESSSENPRRGRPPAVDPEMFDALTQFCDSKSRRGQVDYCYRLDAISALRDDPARFGWLYDHEAAIAGGSAMKASLLTELGRIGDPDRIRAVADRICELKPSSRNGVRMIRQFRVGRPRGDAAGLSSAIIKTLNDYAAGHAVDDAIILEGLRLAYRAAVNSQRSRKSEASSEKTAQ